MSAKYVRGAVAWFVVVRLDFPLKWSMWMLPWAGDYAYWNDPWVRWCREANYRSHHLDRQEPFR